MQLITARARVVLCLLAAATIMLAPACSSKHIYIDKALVPPPRTGPGACDYEQTRTASALFAGKMDVAVAKSYQADLLVEASAQAQLTGARVKVTRVDGTVLDELAQTMSVTINGSGIVEIVAVGPAVANGIVAGDHNGGAFRDFKLCDRDAALSVIANITLLGQVGGSDVESDEFPFPIRVCRGCLVDFSCAPGVRARCDALPFANEACKVGACHPGQDTGDACQRCTGDAACDFSKSSFCP